MFHGPRDTKYHFILEKKRKDIDIWILKILTIFELFSNKKKNLYTILITYYHAKRPNLKSMYQNHISTSRSTNLETQYLRTRYLHSVYISQKGRKTRNILMNKILTILIHDISMKQEEIYEKIPPQLLDRYHRNKPNL